MERFILWGTSMRAVIASGSLILATFYEGTVPVLPDYGFTAEVQCDATGFKLCISQKEQNT